jgi:hypothetical protein
MKKETINETADGTEERGTGVLPTFKTLSVSVVTLDNSDSQ